MKKGHHELMNFRDLVPGTGELSNRLMVDFLAFVKLWGGLATRGLAIFDKKPPVMVKISDNYTHQ